MTVVEERKGNRDQFPVGMRVLAVDDDTLCLKLLEALLLRCQYKVTTTDKAITALRLLRENKDKFDLVISDVHMPDMDGFRLLELVGLEMDLPVIMLSANGETQTVMKGISHGACDYLLKPVRIEELRNIWQHVIRRKKFETRCHNDPTNKEDCQKAKVANSKDDQGKSYHNRKIDNKQKDQNEEDEDNSEDNMQENEDPSTQKKPRVVWTIELHRKFVAAVNQLGIDKAVPKKVLDLMNVEKLTRENVASHLQKYRLYLKRLSIVAGQQAGMVVAAGGRNSSNLHMASLNGLRSYYATGGSRQLPTLGSPQPHGVPGRMNSPSALGMHGLLPSQTVQGGSVHKNTSSSCNDLGKVQGITLPGNHQMSLLEGLPINLELEQFQQPKLVQEPKRHLSTGLCGSGPGPGPCSGFPNVSNNLLLLQANKQHNQSGGLGNYSSARMSSSSSELLKIDLQDVSQFPSISGCDVSWQDAVLSTKNSTNVLSGISSFGHNDLSPGNIGGNISPLTPHAASKVVESPVAVAHLRDPMASNDAQNQVHFLSRSTFAMPAGVDKDPKFPNSNIIGNSRQKWDTFNSNAISSTSSSSSLPNPRITDATTQCQIPDFVFPNKRLDVDVIGRVNFGAPLVTQDCIINKSTSDGQLNLKRGYLLETTNLETHLNTSGCGLGDLVNDMMKPECDDVDFGDMDFSGFL